MNVVIVNDYLCYPPYGGNRLRTLNLMVRLAQNHRLLYLCRGDPDREEAKSAVSFLNQQGIEVHLIKDASPCRSGFGFYARLASNLFSSSPYAVSSHNSPLLRRAIRKHAARNQVDLWQFESIPYADSLHYHAGARTLVVAHNVESLIWQRYFENEGQYWKRWYFKEQWRKMKRYERRVMHQVTRVVAVTEKDAQLLRSQFRLDHVDVVDNGIDRDFFASVRAPRNPHAILFLGSLNWRPNLDAVHSLLNHIFPTVKKEEPEAELWLVGSNPPPWLFRQAQEQPGVQVHGNVPDVRPYLGQCAVMAVPLRIGGGSRLKILEALACGTPVVSTKIGAEGLCLQPSQHYLEVDRIDQMAPILLSCLRNPGPVLALAEQGRQIALQRYDWNVLATRLEAVWKKCLVG